MTSYPTLASAGTAETRVLGSRFLAIAFPLTDESTAREVLAAREREWFDASHHCSAWRLRDGLWRANDAGEPGGSAGPSILAAIDREGLLDCGVIVTRYFGGTKLGVGGLARSYGDAARAALDAAPRRVACAAARYILRYDYTHTAAVMRALERVHAREVEHGYEDAQGRISFSVPIDEEAALAELLRESTGGGVSAERLGERTLYRDGAPRPPAGHSLDARNPPG